MAYFQWADDMVIDNGPIDQDHRKLVEQVNALHTATTEGRGQEVVGALLEALIHDTVQHIQREEQQMAALGYPHLEQHQKGHALFMADLHGLRTKYQSGGITVAAQLSTLLRDWLSLHIRRYDKEMVGFIRQKDREGRTVAHSRRPAALLN